MSNSPFLSSISLDMRQKGYALKTEKTYLYWIKSFILFHRKRHPQTMGSEEVRQFLSSLANEKYIAINTQKIALNALAFLYNKFLKQPLGDIDYIPASKPRNLPIVISISSVKTTQIYTHVLGEHFAGTTSPVDGLALFPSSLQN